MKKKIINIIVFFNSNYFNSLTIHYTTHFYKKKYKVLYIRVIDVWFSRYKLWFFSTLYMCYISSNKNNDQ